MNACHVTTTSKEVDFVQTFHSDKPQVCMTPQVVLALDHREVSSDLRIRLKTIAWVLFFLTFYRWYVHNFAAIDFREIILLLMDVFIFMKYISK